MFLLKIQVLLEPLVTTVRTEPRETKDTTEQTDTRERQEIKVSLDLRDPRDHVEILAAMGKMV